MVLTVSRVLSPAYPSFPVTRLGLWIGHTMTMIPFTEILQQCDGLLYIVEYSLGEIINLLRKQNRAQTTAWPPAGGFENKNTPSPGFSRHEPYIIFQLQHILLTGDLYGDGCSAIKCKPSGDPRWKPKWCR
jgi:hypothetical protein